ncbi:MAG: SMP-30/gluconolactonase/LRE family protein [Gemmatimonadetes bacterium]|nr:SMP-30/gluconolactonase/LRE family protein [Gemmatimonadota bacterium]
MRHHLVVGALLPLALFARSTVAQSDTSLVAAGAKLERVFCCGVFLEGPAAAPDGSIYFTDITATYNYVGRPLEQQGGVIRRYDPKTGVTTVYQSPSAMATGLEFAPNGQMYITHAAHLGTRMVTRIDLKTGLGYIAAHRYNGRPYNSPNDLAADHQGRIFFSDPRYIGDEPIDQPVLGVYRIDTDGSQHLITADLGKPNGVALSPDQKTLYVSSVGKAETDRLPQPVPTRSSLEAIAAYDLDVDGNVKFRKLVVDYLATPSRPETNGPDGIDTDVFGNIWGTQLAWKAVVAYSPDGRELGRIPVEEGATNLEFGRGAEADVLYITGKTGLYKVKVKSRGWHAGQR